VTGLRPYGINYSRSLTGHGRRTVLYVSTEIRWPIDGLWATLSVSKRFGFFRLPRGLSRTGHSPTQHSPIQSYQPVGYPCALNHYGYCIRNGPFPTCLARTRRSRKKQTGHGCLSRLLENNMRLQEAALCHVLLLKTDDMMGNSTPYRLWNSLHKEPHDKLYVTKRRYFLWGGEALVITDQTIRYVDT
jgi:hypothetical protein